MAVNTDKIYFPYQEEIYYILLYPGTYKLEVWGAQGGSSSVAKGGLGGYAYGEIELTKVTKLYVVIGGQGKAGTSPGVKVEGGYNGGGSCIGGGSSSYPEYKVSGNSGGGATHIATQTGLLSELKDYKSTILLVAGGGGGASGTSSASTSYKKGGAGGGISGNDGEPWTKKNYGTGEGGTQTRGGTNALNYEIENRGITYGNSSFGTGGSILSAINYDNGWIGGAGGGGYYGGGAGGSISAGGGGSGYTSSQLTNSGMSNGKRSGDGYAIITLLSYPSSTEYINTNYTININHDNGFNGAIVKSQSLENEYPISITPILKPGYNWSYWTGDYRTNTDGLQEGFMSPGEVLSLAADRLNDGSITAHMHSYADSATYTVKHYLMNVDGSTYALDESQTYTSTTDALVTADVKTYDGFISPARQSAIVKSDNSTVIVYNYIRNKHKITIQGGTSSKSEYYYQETGDIIFDESAIDASKIFKQWVADSTITIDNVYDKNTTFVMPDHDVTFFAVYEDNRLNSNVYKNIFPEEVIDLEYVESLKEDIIVSCNEIVQENHGFEVNDVLAYDPNTGYSKAIATKSTKSVIGIVSKVRNANVFTLMTEGQLPYPVISSTDTTILYLSDKEAGKMVHYQEIENMVYIPIAIYTDKSIIINIQEGSSDTLLSPYEAQQDLSVERYDTAELQDIVDTIIGG